MSTRIGMADGRCLTEFTSNRLMTEALMQTQKIDVEDNYKFRTQYLQTVDSLNLPLRNAACRDGMVSVLVDQQEGMGPPKGTC
jgi:hypothetical protein